MNELRLSGIDRGDECELLVFVDGVDVLASLDAVGAEPDQVLAELQASDPDRRVEIGHCGCGDPTCGSVSVQVRTEDHHVWWAEWSSSLGFDLPPDLCFDRDRYTREVDRAQSDRPWESREREFARRVAALIDAHAQDALAWRGLEFLDVAPAGDGAVAVRFRAEVADARWSIYALFALNDRAESVRDLLVRKGPTSWPVVAWWGENEAAAFVQPPMAGKRWRMWEPL